MLTKFVTIGIIYAISFLGYNPSDFLNILPTQIKSALEQNVSTSTNSQTNTQTNSNTNLKEQATTSVTIPKEIRPTQKTQPKKGEATSSQNTTENIPPKIIVSAEQIKIPKTNLATSSTTTSPAITQNITSQTSGNLLSNSSTVDQKISAAVVNIYCQAIRGSQIEIVVGSAVQIDPSGVYLTNAHVAMYVMLSDTEPSGTVSCFIREGEPAKKIYEAKSIYVPSAWIYSHTNAFKIGTELTGTGEKDYALVKRGNSNPNLNSSDFPAEWSAPLAQNIPLKGENITLVGYPVFDKSTITSALYLLNIPSTVLNSFNLNSLSNALLDSGSTRMAQVGSSGGGAFDSNGNLFGIMDASINNTPGELPSERIIGINYIKNDILRDTGKSFESFLTNANSESENFIKNSAPALSKVLISNQ